MAKRLRRLGRRHQIAELKVLAAEATERRERYKIDDCISSIPGVVAVDLRISAIYKEAAGLIGMDGPREDLVSWLMDSHKKLKVVSIVGFGGLGKTTLAKQVYDEIGGQFSCRAFVSVSQRPDVKSLLVGLQCKLGMGKSSCAHELQDIIDRLREYLKHKRYFILVDDLGDQSTWNIINCVFPESSNGSRVMVTTRLDDVAVTACHNDRACIYRMKHLGEQDSRRLFFNRVFGSENSCPPQFKEISSQILKKCGGLPLAIITIASLLASHEARTLSEWESIKKSLGSKFSTKSTLEEMRHILNLSYMHLPIHLQPCLLYLGMYPEDYQFWKDILVQQWIAEGFIYSSHGFDLEDVAKSYFSELVNRSLIQPVNTCGGEVRSCRVHDMILDLILSKSTEDNFISVAYNYEDMARLNSYEYKVHRLSLRSSDVRTTSKSLTTSMAQVRSYACFTKSKYAPPLSDFKYLRVLYFEFAFKWNTIIDLTAIGHLFLLRYLRVYAPLSEVALPAEIQGLLHLETLELHCDSAESFPSDITRLTNLFHLRLPDGTTLPRGIRNMKSVRDLACSGVSESLLEDIKGLRELTNLNRLALSTPDSQCLTVELVDTLVSSIGRLKDLKWLCLHCEIESDGSNSLDTIPDPPPRLEVLELKGWQFSRVPKWIGELCCLQALDLRVLYLSSNDIRVLGELPSLFSASFHVSDISQNKIVIGTGLFSVLEDVWFWSDEDVSACLSFEAGCMPKLQKLYLGLCWKEWMGATPVGMECLLCLQDIEVWPVFTDTESSTNWDEERRKRAAIESAFRSATSVHSRHPSVKIC